jgi:CHASE1-domain containing sensor protein
MDHAILPPITLAIIGLTLITLAASKTTVNDSVRTQQMFERLAETRLTAG